MNKRQRKKQAKKLSKEGWFLGKGPVTKELWFSKVQEPTSFDVMMPWEISGPKHFKTMVLGA